LPLLVYKTSKNPILKALCGVKYFNYPLKSLSNQALSKIANGSGGEGAGPVNTSVDIIDSSMKEAEPENNSVDTAAVDADYILDYENGSTALGELPVGSRIADPTWTWEYRPGYSCSNECPNSLEPLDPGETKPVVWIIVAVDHYNNAEPHVILMAEEVIGRYSFDGSLESARLDEYFGHNHWNKSGTTDFIPGLRPWLNATGHYSEKGFYQAFSKSFKNIIITTDVPNREWKTGDHYSTQDKVFIPSTTELGDTDHFYSFQIGSTYSYFSAADSIDQTARLGNEPVS